MLIRRIEAGLQACTLLFFRNIEENLYDRRAFVRQHLLEVDDVLVATLPDLLREKLLHAHRDDILIMTPVEYR